MRSMNPMGSLNCLNRHFKKVQYLIVLPYIRKTIGTVPRSSKQVRNDFEQVGNSEDIFSISLWVSTGQLTNGTLEG